MNLFKGVFGHSVRFFNSTKNGQMISDAPKRAKRPAGMSGRQWKKKVKQDRRDFNNRVGKYAGTA